MENNPITKRVVVRAFRANRLALICLPMIVLCFVGSVDFLAHGRVFAQNDKQQKIKTLIRQANKECRAARNMRRSDLEAAKDHFNLYREIIKEALQINPELIDSPDSNTERVLNYCKATKRDLDRAEALPLFEQGLQECAEAKIMISNASFDEAEEKFRNYVNQKETALAITDSVNEVYENSYRVRLCDQLGEEIKLAKAEYQRQLKEQARAARNIFAEVLSGLNQAERGCRGATNLVNDTGSYNSQTVAQIGNLAAEAKKEKEAAIKLRDELLAKNKRPNKKTADQITSIITVIDQCQAGLPAGVKRVRTVLAARQTNTKVSSATKAENLNKEYRQIVGAPAKYPSNAVRRGIEGEVIVSFSITKSGEVENIEIVSADPPGVFDKSVKRAVGKYKFQPRIRDGEPVEVKKVERKVVFKLR